MLRMTFSYVMAQMQISVPARQHLENKVTKVSQLLLIYIETPLLTVTAAMVLLFQRLTAMTSEIAVRYSLQFS